MILNALAVVGGFIIACAIIVLIGWLCLRGLKPGDLP